MGEHAIAAPARAPSAHDDRAFRLTVEDHADRVAVRTKDDELRLTWGSCATAWTRSPAGWPASASGGETPSR